MGNICSKSANQDDHFSTPGQTLGSAPAQPVKRQIPQNLTSTTPGRQLGSRDGTSSPDDARRAAAQAAEERAALNNSKGGKLASNLAAQKKQTQNQTLNSLAREEVQVRNADSNAQTAAYN